MYAAISCETPVAPSRTWPHDALGTLALVITMVGDYTEATYRWQIITAQPDEALARLAARGIAATVVGSIAPPDAPPLLRWATRAAAGDDLRARYLNAPWERVWTAQEAADYAWLDAHETPPADWDRTLTPPARALRTAAYRYGSRRGINPSLARPDLAEHLLGVLNALRQRAGLYPVDARLEDVLPPVQPIASSRPGP